MKKFMEFVNERNDLVLDGTLETEKEVIGVICREAQVYYSGLGYSARQIRNKIGYDEDFLPDALGFITDGKSQ